MTLTFRSNGSLASSKVRSMRRSSRQNKRQNRQHDDVNNSDDGEDVRPTHVAGARVELTRAQTADALHFVRRPAERVDDAAQEEKHA